MKRILPGRVEVLIFAAAAVVGAGVVSQAQSQDLVLSVMSIPLFLTAAVVGMIKSGRYTTDGQLAGEQVETEDADTE